MKYAIYCRKSTDTEDRQVLSLESQRTELLAIAAREDLEIVSVYLESMTAKQPGRPVFNSIIKMVEDGLIDGILCWKIDRLVRNPVDAGQINWLLQCEKIKCIATFEKKFYPSDNVMYMSIEQAMATQYIRDLSTNVKRGNRAKLERGGWPSIAPLGYVNDKANKEIIKHTKIAPYIHRAFSLYATGLYSMKQISNMLYSEGLRSASGYKIHTSKIHKLFLNKFYCGLMERYGKVYVGNHTPIVSLALFEQAQDVLFNRKHPRAKKHTYAARGFLRCGQCNCAITGDTKKGYVYYYCTNGKRICTQHTHYLRAEYVDTLIAELLTALYVDEDTIELMAQSVKETNSSQESYITQANEQLEHTKQSLAQKELQLVEGYSATIIREDLYLAKMKELEQRRAELIIQEHALKHQKRQTIDTFELVKNALLQGNTASNSYIQASEEEKRTILGSVLSNIYLKDKNIVSYQFKKPFDLIANTPKKGDFDTMRALWNDIAKAFITIQDTDTTLSHKEGG